MAKKRYGTDIKKIQTDKGSEFMKDFRKGVKALSEKHKGYYNHVFGYTGRSQAQGLVERFNGTLKRLLLRHLNYKVGADWQDHLAKAVSNYNGNPHRVIKMAPNSVKPSNYKEVKRNILDRAKKSKRFQGVVYKPGDFVRLKIYKPKRLKPSYTFKKGPLYELKKESRYKGVFMISQVNTPKGKNSISKAPTYSIIALWSKESTPDWYEVNQEQGGTLPSGVKIKNEVINIAGSVFDGLTFARGSFARKFVKDELVRVPMDRKGQAIAEGIEEIADDAEPESEDEEPVKPKQKVKKVFNPPKLKKGSKVKVRFYSGPKGSLPFTESARARGVGKKTKAWYEGEVKGIDLKKHEWSVYFPSDKETAVLTSATPPRTTS